ncbi:hypothetical protein QE152_g10335 [Popillia japonica]|uniref:Uncharacterized protein n=1 Tax=Popillia japonica TaxID=7064 RepID=A0AAW1LUW7_POPJA
MRDSHHNIKSVAGFECIRDSEFPEFHEMILFVCLSLNKSKSKSYVSLVLGLHHRFGLKDKRTGSGLLEEQLTEQST